MRDIPGKEAKSQGTDSPQIGLSSLGPRSQDPGSLGAGCRRCPRCGPGLAFKILRAALDHYNANMYIDGATTIARPESGP